MNNLPSPLTVLALFASLLVAETGAFAKTLYVTPSGNDSVSYAANGPSAPWATIGRAAWGSTSRTAPNTAEAAQPGDTVLVSAGTYTTTGTDERFHPAYNPANSGTASNPITFQAEGTVVLRFSSGSGPVIGACGICGTSENRRKDFIVWRGFTINEVDAPSRPDTGPVVLWATDGSVIENNTINGILGNPRLDNYNGVRLDGATNVTVRNNRISNFQGAFGRNHACVMSYWSGNFTIENNEFLNCGAGIYLKADFPNTGSITIRKNLFSGCDFSGVLVHRDPNTVQYPIRIYQNIVKNSQVGFSINAFDIGATDPRNVKIVNNVVYNTANSGLNLIRDMTENSGHLFWNNIISGSSMAIYHEVLVPNLVKTRFDSEHNVFFPSGPFGEIGGNDHTLSTWRSTYGQDGAVPLSIAADPLFVAPGTDFHLTSGSPARTLGVDILDLNGNGSTTDIIPAGVYITGTEILGPSGALPPVDSLAPASPTGLTASGN